MGLRPHTTLVDEREPAGGQKNACKKTCNIKTGTPLTRLTRLTRLTPIIHWLVASPSTAMLSLPLVLLACANAASITSSRKPALQDGSIQKRLQTLLHSPSRSALADVLDGSYHPAARPGYQRTAIGMTMLAVMTACVSTLVWLLLDKLHFLHGIERRPGRQAFLAVFFGVLCGILQTCAPYAAVWSYIPERTRAIHAAIGSLLACCLEGAAALSV